jgi:hypothetical protein
MPSSRKTCFAVNRMEKARGRQVLDDPYPAFRIEQEGEAVAARRR